ncbi:MAG: peptidylprolyl isomerase [Bifidobacteriaceae bacterium]|jgi:peptidyl-prolyl cis-trans isomerase B (cyclophilin B)|nr:peptidylprolyl isomerase [Bifidobacteriaceae bacterium]
MMAKRNLKRERERAKALARQEEMARRARRAHITRITAGLTVAALALTGVGAVVVTAILSAREKSAAETPIDFDPNDQSDLAGLGEDDLNPDGTGQDAPADWTDPIGGEGRAVYSAAPDPSLAEGREWTGTMRTSVGDLEFTLDGAAAPQATANFIQLARDGYYDDSWCHRLTTSDIWVLQCGSLTGDGTDSPGYTFGPLENVPEDGVYPVGTIAMARAGTEDSQGAQFFIVYQETTLPGGYSVFGHVTSGLDVIEAVAANGALSPDGQGKYSPSGDGRPITTVTIDGIELK